MENATFYKRRSRYGGMEVSDARKLKALEEENRKLKKLRAESLLDAATLKGMLGKKLCRASLSLLGRREAPCERQCSSSGDCELRCFSPARRRLSTASGGPARTGAARVAASPKR